mgnify:CR=1 FL=1
MAKLQKICLKKYFKHKDEKEENSETNDQRD